MKATTLTASNVYKSVAETVGLKPKEVKGAVEAVMGLASGELKKHGSFKLAGMLALKLKKKPATPARKGVNQLSKEMPVGWWPGQPVVQEETARNQLEEIQSSAASSQVKDKQEAEIKGEQKANVTSEQEAGVDKPHHAKRLCIRLPPAAGRQELVKGKCPGAAKGFVSRIVPAPPP